MPSFSCSCGCTAAHRIARGTTADGVPVELYSDGQVTYAMGYHIRGVGVARSDYDCTLNVQAGWLLMGDISMFDADEVPRLVASARKAVRQSFDSPKRAMLKIFDGKRIQTLGNGVFKWAA